MKQHYTKTRRQGYALWSRALLLAGLLLPLSGWASTSGLVISQVYGGGGNAGSYYRNDFIELFNNAATDFVVPVGGYSVQYAAATGAPASWGKTEIPAGTIIPAKGYLLVQEAAGTAGAAFSSDLQGSIAMAAGGGKVALVSNNIALSGQQSNPNSNSSIIDFVGYGTANAYETNPTPAPSAVNSAVRKGSGTVDTDNNLVDFLTMAAAPRSSSMPTVVTEEINGVVFPSFALLNGTILRTGGTATNVTDRGFLYSASPSPRLGSASATNGAGGTGTFTNKFTGLMPGTTYYLAAYSINANGTSYGSDVKFTTPLTINLYTKSSGLLNAVSTFGTNADGSGSMPDSFSDAGQLYLVAGTGRTIDANLTVSGDKSKVVVQNGASFLVPATANFTGTVDLSANASLVNSNATPGIKLGNLDATSTVEFNQTTNYLVPQVSGVGYGNLTLRNNTKRLLAGTTIVRGNLLVSNVGSGTADVFGGDQDTVSTLTLGGNLTLSGTVKFSATAEDRISLEANNTSTAQVLDGGGNLIKLLRVTLTAGQAGLSLANGTSSIELGTTMSTTPGSGYQLATGTVFTLNNNTLSFVTGGMAAIASGASFAGELALSPGTNLYLSKTNSASIGILRLTAASTQLNNLTLDISGTTASTTNLTLLGDLTVNGTLTLTNGTLTLTPGKQLTLNGPVTSTPTGQIRFTDADVLISGTGLLSSLNFGGQGRNFTLNRPGSILSMGSDMTVNGAFALTSGTLDIGDNNLYLNGSVATSAVGMLNGSNVSNLRVAGSGPLGSLYFTPSGGVLNTFSLYRPNGTLLIVGNPLQITRPTLFEGVLSLDAGVALSITGPLVVDNPTVAQFAGTPTSSINFTGSGAIGPLAFVPGQDVLQGFTLARNTTSAVPTAQLTTNLTVNNLTLNRGRLFVQGNAKLTVLPGGGISGGGPNSYVNTLTQSSVTNVFTSTVALSYPLGVDGQYRPLTYTVTDQSIGTTAYTAHQYEERSPVRTLPATLARVSQIRYYNLVREAGGTSTPQSATIRLSYVASNDLVTSATVSFLRVAMTDPTDATKWANIGGVGTGSDITSGVFAAGPLGDFTLATDINTPVNTNPLPVELTAFAAERRSDQFVSVTWATASEKQADRFEVQRSADSRAFETIATATAQGSSSQATRYAALDKTAPAGPLYYRLRQVDLDGTVAYSPVVRVGGAAALELAVYPNPATERLTATAAAQAGRRYRVLNAVGQVLATGAAEQANPSVEVRSLPAGSYLLELLGPGGRQVRRFVKGN
jgi:hypothetical protein